MSDDRVAEDQKLLTCLVVWMKSDDLDVCIAFTVLSAVFGSAVWAIVHGVLQTAG